MTRKRLFGISLSILTLAGAALAGPNEQSNRDNRRPAFVQWNPQVLRAQVALGQTSTYSASFRCTRDLQNVTLLVNSPLEPYIKLDVASFASVTAGTTYTVNLTLTTPPALTSLEQDARYGFAGIMQMRAGGRMVPGHLKLQFYVPEPEPETLESQGGHSGAH